MSAKAFKKNKEFFAIGVILIILVLGVASCVSGISMFLRQSEYFIIQEVASKNNEFNLSYLKGRNIFSVDLRALSLQLENRYSGYSKIRITRLLPGILWVDFLKRSPVAFVKLYRYFYTDEEGVLFLCEENSPVTGMPVITGLDTKIFGAQSGKKYQVRELKLAIEIATAFREKKSLKGYALREIDASPPEGFSCMIYPLPFGRGIEVRFDLADLKEKISLLGNLLNQSSKSNINIKYVDLRFKEPAIKFYETD
ncbi:MAG: cell division protein FtsQ [Candidatus Omnitrophica bacterium]|jgi:hypothetical protein|nr:cell division protein FtsQ [Candidatus Omnitrophota bacterium]